MKTESGEIVCTVDVKPGEKLTLPPSLVDSLGPGRWLVSVRPFNGPAGDPVMTPSCMAMRQGTRGCTMILPGEFWVADIPFTNQTASKKRPVLALWVDAADVVVATVTTASARSMTDVALSDWQAGGGSRPTARLPPAHSRAPTCIAATTNGLSHRHGRFAARLRR